MSGGVFFVLKEDERRFVSFFEVELYNSFCVEEVVFVML